MKIVVSGYVASYPIAGFFWHYVNFVLGFAALGHDVWYIEDSGDVVWGWDVARNRPDDSLAAGAAFLEREMAAVGLADRWAVRVVPRQRTIGMSAEQVWQVLDEADVFVNVSCSAPPRPEYRQVPHRIAIDTDPVFTQIRIARGDPRRAWIPEFHTRLFTFGIGQLPAQRHEWLATRQPVAHEVWPAAGEPDAADPFTTVAAWQAYPPEVWDGRSYAGKDATFQSLLDLPKHTKARLTVALGGRGDDRDAEQVLTGAGWHVSDGIAATQTSDSYRAFIARSLGEIGIAKQGYVTARSGWFSERTCCYLASGRPAVVQNTGFTDWLPVGEGLLAFDTARDAIAAIDAIRDDPARHARAARALVETHFDAATVCGELLARS